MGLSNLPPGVRDCDLPGNTREDAEWDAFFEWMNEGFGKFDGLDVYEARRAVLIGVAAVKAEREEINTLVRVTVADKIDDDRMQRAMMENENG